MSLSGEQVWHSQVSTEQYCTYFESRGWMIKKQRFGWWLWTKWILGLLLNQKSRISCWRLYVCTPLWILSLGESKLKCTYQCINVSQVSTLFESHRPQLQAEKDIYTNSKPCFFLFQEVHHPTFTHQTSDLLITEINRDGFEWEDGLTYFEMIWLLTTSEST